MRLRNVDWVKEILNLGTRQRAYELARLGLIPSVRIGRTVRFDEDQIREFVRTGGRGLPGGWRRDTNDGDRPRPTA